MSTSLTCNPVPVHYYLYYTYFFVCVTQVCIVNDPRNDYNKMYTVEYLGNLVNGRKVLYLNQPVEVLKYLAAASLRDNEVQE